MLETTAVVTNMGYNSKKDEIWFECENVRKNIKLKGIANGEKLERGYLINVKADENRFLGYGRYIVTEYEILDK